MRIKNLFLKSLLLVVAKENIQFDAEGVAEVSDEVGKSLANLKNYQIIEGSNPEPELIPEQTDEVALETNAVAEEEGEEPRERTDEEEDKMLEDMTVNQLEKYAKEKGIPLKGVSKKVDIIKVLQANN